MSRTSSEALPMDRIDFNVVSCSANVPLSSACSKDQVADAASASGTAVTKRTCDPQFRQFELKHTCHSCFASTRQTNQHDDAAVRKLHAQTERRRHHHLNIHVMMPPAGKALVVDVIRRCYSR
jgi:hypothetical protein